MRECDLEQSATYPLSRSKPSLSSKLVRKGARERVRVGVLEGLKTWESDRFGSECFGDALSEARISDDRNAPRLHSRERNMAWPIESKITRRVVTIDENKSALDAALLMTEEFIGSLVVTSSSKITGLFTERELMMRVVGKRRDAEKVQIREVMTKDPIRVSPTDTTPYCLDLMKERRCRHLLVFAGDQFIGIVSLRDIVALMLEEKDELIKCLEKYIAS